MKKNQASKSLLRDLKGAAPDGDGAQQSDAAPDGAAQQSDGVPDGAAQQSDGVPDGAARLAPAQVQDRKG
jgi:hypothetical protein